MKHLYNCVTNVWLTLWLRKYFSINTQHWNVHSAKFTSSLLWPLWKSASFGKYWIVRIGVVVVPWYSDVSDGNTMVLKLLLGYSKNKVTFKIVYGTCQTIVCRSKIHVIWYFWYLYFVPDYLKVWLVKLSYFLYALILILLSSRLHLFDQKTVKTLI